MSGWKKLASAAAAAGGGLNVEDLFSTYLWEGDASNPRTITNGIDLSGEGGLTIIKRRDGGTQNWGWWDTVRGPDSFINSNSFNAENTTVDKDLTDFNSDGFTLGANHNLDVNSSGGDFCSWSFRKAPKFFDIVEYSGDSTSGRTVSHNLGSVPGAILIKCTSSSATNWSMFHREMHASSPQAYRAILNSDNQPDQSTGFWNNTLPTDTEFTLGNNAEFNKSGRDFIAYLFAHNDGDGEFGPDGDQDIIKCGSYQGNGSSTGPIINLGWEPQWVLVKRFGSADWQIMDNMRGMPVQYSGSYTNKLSPNSNAAETSPYQFNPTATGFQPRDSSTLINGSSRYFYIAIRRGPMAVPTAATNVFAIDQGDSGGSSDVPEFDAGFPVDMGINKATSGSAGQLHSRLNDEKVLYTTYSDAEGNAVPSFDFQDGYYGSDKSSSYYAWMWRRAPEYLDVVAYEGDGQTAQNITHNLQAVPEMMWVKGRNEARDWNVYHTGLNGGTTPEDYYIRLNSSSAQTDAADIWNDTGPTDTQFTVGSSQNVNKNASQYIAFLFSTVSGVSKVGSFTGTGANGLNIDCGFSSGARFVLLKNVNRSSQWYVWDTERGIVAGNDPWLAFDTAYAQQTSNDYIDPYSAGFTVNYGAADYMNTSGDTHIFYAIA